MVFELPPWLHRSRARGQASGLAAAFRTRRAQSARPMREGGAFDERASEDTQWCERAVDPAGNSASPQLPAKRRAFGGFVSDQAVVIPAQRRRAKRDERPSEPGPAGTRLICSRSSSRSAEGGGRAGVLSKRHGRKQPLRRVVDADKKGFLRQCRREKRPGISATTFSSRSHTATVRGETLVEAFTSRNPPDS